MSALKDFQSAADRPIDLSDGRSLAPGEVVRRADAENTHNRFYIDEGLLIEVAPEVSSYSDEELTEFVDDSTVQTILLAASEDSELAGRLLAAEKARSEPRKGVLDKLTSDQEKN